VRSHAEDARREDRYQVPIGTSLPMIAVEGIGPKHRLSKDAGILSVRRKTSPRASARQPCYAGNGRSVAVDQRRVGGDAAVRDDDAGIGADEIAGKRGDALDHRHRRREIVALGGQPCRRFRQERQDQIARSAGGEAICPDGTRSAMPRCQAYPNGRYLAFERWSSTRAVVSAFLDFLTSHMDLE
jgi:hypothetical protein